MDKKYFRFLILTISAVFICISLHISASAVQYDNDGNLVFTGSSFGTYENYANHSANIVVDSNHSVPSNYRLVAYYYVCGWSSRSTCTWIYAPDTVTEMTAYLDSQGRPHWANTPSSTPFYLLTNNFFSDNTQAFISTQSGSYSSQTLGVNSELTVLISAYDDNGIIVRPENQVNFVLNSAIIKNRLVANCFINSGDASHVDFYMFPASAPISGGSSSNIVPTTPQNQLTEEQKDSFLVRGFKDILYGIDDLIVDLSSPIVSLDVCYSSRSSNIFNPDSYNLSYEYLGKGVLFSSGSISGTPSVSISMSDILGYHTGVYSYQSLKLVAVCTYSNRSFIATYDFNPSAINNGAPVAPSSITPSDSYPTFDNPNSDFKELADYLKNLYETQNINNQTDLNNLLAGLGAMPWANFMSNGFINAMPNLSFTLDHLFDSLFDKFTAPTQDQIDEMYAEVQAERTELRDKLAFVDDVKTELYFVISTITADNNSVPPNFRFTLPSMWSGGQELRVSLVSYSIATPEVMANIKQVVTVFLSLSLLLHIWRTLPSTVGNMPKGGD